MVDYSKWANFGDDEVEDEVHQHPRVTTFEGEKGRSFIIGPAGASLVKVPTVSASIPPPEEPLEFLLDHQNGAVTQHFTWSQDRQEVCIRKIVPSSLKASHLRISYDPCSNSLSVKDNQTGSDLFNGILRYKFAIDDEDDLCPVPWELVTRTNGSSAVKKDIRILELVLKKVSPIPGSIIWWKNVFVSDPEIDVTSIPGREKVSQEVADAWDEAHKLFKERISTREKVIVNLDDDNDDDDDEIVER